MKRIAGLLNQCALSLLPPPREQSQSATVFRSPPIPGMGFLHSLSLRCLSVSQITTVGLVSSNKDSRATMVRTTNAWLPYRSRERQHCIARPEFPSSFSRAVLLVESVRRSSPPPRLRQLFGKHNARVAAPASGSERTYGAGDGDRVRRRLLRCAGSLIRVASAAGSGGLATCRLACRACAPPTSAPRRAGH